MSVVSFNVEDDNRPHPIIRFLLGQGTEFNGLDRPLEATIIDRHGRPNLADKRSGRAHSFIGWTTCDNPINRMLETWSFSKEGTVPASL